MKLKRFRNKFISMLLTLAMLLTLFPLSLIHISSCTAVYNGLAESYTITYNPVRSCLLYTSRCV